MTATPNGHHHPEQSDAALARRVLAMVMDQSHECVQVLRTLLAASPDGDGATQAEVVWQLRDYGLEPEETMFEAASDLRERRTVAARRAGSGGGRSLLLLAHPDGMPFDGAAGWSVDPFAGEVHDGRIYGWGVADDLSGVAALLLIPRMLRILRADLAGDVVLVSAPNVRSKPGSVQMLEAGFAADALVHLRPPADGAGLSMIQAISPETQLYRSVGSAVTAIIGREPRYETGHFAGEMRQPTLNEQLPAVGIGPRAGDLTQAGGRNEWLELDDYLRMIAVCTLVTIQWCGAAV